MPKATLIYQGVDITQDVDMVECVHTDVSGGACDCLNIKLDHAEKWFGWGPEKNDTIQILRNGYDTGTLYLNTVAPEDGAYRILATSAKCVPFLRESRAYQKTTLDAIMTACAGECGMGAKQYGAASATYYAYLLRREETPPAFLERLCGLEGAVMKTFAGNFTAIDVLTAQGLPAMHELNLEADQMDSRYTDRRDILWKSVEIKTPFGSGSARDSAADGADKLFTHIAVDDDAQAKRWARGLLLMHNRLAESLEIEMDFNPGYTAMARINVNSKTAAAGEWVIDQARHDFINGRTRAKLLRCRTEIA